MVAHRVRNILRFGKRLNRDQWNWHSELVEGSAKGWKRAAGIARQGGAKPFGILEGCIPGAHEVPGALRTATGTQAEGRKREVLALPGKDSVRSAGPVLRCPRWLSMVVEPAMFVVGDENDGIFPIAAVANRVDHLRHVLLPSLNVGGGMLIIFELRSQDSEIGIDEGHLW